MSKQNAKSDNGHITPALVRNVDAVLTSAAKYTYSTSGVYAAHNQVFKLNETPESCASCLLNRVNNLRKWYSEYALEQANKGLDQYGNKLTEAQPTVQVPRGTFGNTADLFKHFDLDLDPANEKANIEHLLNPDPKAPVLAPEETQMLQDRLAELNAPPVIEDEDTSIIVTDKDGVEWVVSYTEGDADAPGKLTYTTDAGEVKNMKPGTYVVANGDKYAVQPGGNTTFKPNEDIL